MIYAVTEICDETGSWLRDFDVASLNEKILDRKMRRESINALDIDKNIVEKIRTEYFIVRKKSFIERSVGYQLHTNRELKLMIVGMKPFSVFSYLEYEDVDVYNGQKFDEYEETIHSRLYKIGEKMYDLKFLDDEWWRTEAFIAIERIREYKGNSEGLELLEGELLGYTKEQNIEYIDKFFSRLKR